jgi:3-dehydroquinate synthase
MVDTLVGFRGQTVPVELGERSYPIYIGGDILPDLGRALACHCGQGRAVLITDANVGPLYASAVVDSLTGVDIKTLMVTAPAGESSKRLAVVETVYEQLFDFAAERSDTVVALGGGVVGDLAGFVAATFKRGLKYVQVPTSLLAMVDSSIGGKTGINHPRGKNMIGAFYQPRMVFADTAVLRTLPDRELGCGLAESVKHAVIQDNEFFAMLEEHAGAILSRQQDVLVDLVVRNCRIKAEVVATDERESGLRGILNFGHTIGHAIETVLAGRDHHHGEAVALGMVAAARLARQHGLLRPEYAERIESLLRTFRLPTALGGDVPVDKLYTAMMQDKKVKAGRINFVLPTSIGSCCFVNDLTEAEIRAAILSLQ